MNNIKEIKNQLDINRGLTYFGGKSGIDYIAFDKKGTILFSGGPLDKLKEVALRHNCAVAMLIPITFTENK